MPFEQALFTSRTHFLSLKVSSKSVGFRAFGDWLLDVFRCGCPSFWKLGMCTNWSGVKNLLFQDTFWRNLCSHVSFPACFRVLCLNRWELLKTAVTSMQWSLACVTRAWCRTQRSITALFLLEKRKEWAISNVLFQHKSPSDLLVALLWVFITSSTLLSSPVDSFVNGKLWKRRSFITLSKCLLKWNTRG